MTHQSRLTVKGQVTIPKDIREALGLEAGQTVEFKLDAHGNARIVKVDHQAEIARKKAEWLNRLAEVRANFQLKDEFAGMDGLEYQQWIRGTGPEV